MEKIKTALDDVIVSFAETVSAKAKKEECSYLLVDSVRVLGGIVTIRRRIDQPESVPSPSVNICGPLGRSVE